MGALQDLLIDEVGEVTSKARESIKLRYNPDRYNIKSKEIKMNTLIEKPIHLSLEGVEKEYEDMQELIGVLNPLNTEFIEFDHDKRARAVKLVGEDNVDLGICYQPFPSEYEQAPYSKDMGVKAVEYLMANHVEMRSLMNEILDASKVGKFSLEFDLNTLAGEVKEKVNTWDGIIRPCF
jgi:hypothetical protein